VRGITLPSRRQDDDVLLKVQLALPFVAFGLKRERERERERERKPLSFFTADKFERPLNRTQLNRLRSCVQYCGGDGCT